MKWFKHFSDANRDPKLISLIDEFGFEGYGMWWIICEVVADQYQANGNPELETSDKGWRKLTGIYPQKFKKVVTFLEKVGLLSVTFTEKGAKVCIDKMQEFKDNHTRNLQATYKQEVEEEVEEEKEEKFDGDSIEFRLARFLFNCIRVNNPKHKKPDLQKWAQHIDYMIRIDLRDPDEIKNVIKWCQEDNAPQNGSNFCWATNILSTDKLRKQYDQLVLKMRGTTVEPEDLSW